MPGLQTATLTVDSPIGRLCLTAAGGTLRALTWGSADREAPDETLLHAARQLAAYFDGRLTRFDLPLAPFGTAFRQRVWAAMMDIPFAATATYGELARTVGTAPRAVGGACGANPLPIVVPCHRVVGGGWPGGYSGQGGLDTKTWLLAHERQVAGRHARPATLFPEHPHDLFT